MEFRKEKKKKEKRERKVALCECIDVVFVGRKYNHNCCKEEVQLVEYWCKRMNLCVCMCVGCVAFFTLIHFEFFTVRCVGVRMLPLDNYANILTRNRHIGSRMSDER